MCSRTILRGGLTSGMLGWVVRVCVKESETICWHACVGWVLLAPGMLKSNSSLMTDCVKHKNAGDMKADDWLLANSASIKLYKRDLDLLPSKGPAEDLVYGCHPKCTPLGQTCSHRRIVRVAVNFYSSLLSLSVSFLLFRNLEFVSHVGEGFVEFQEGRFCRVSDLIL